MKYSGSSLYPVFNIAKFDCITTFAHFKLAMNDTFVHFKLAMNDLFSLM